MQRRVIASVAIMAPLLLVSRTTGIRVTSTVVVAVTADNPCKLLRREMKKLFGTEAQLGCLLSGFLHM